MFGQYILLCLQLYLIYYISECGHRQIAEPLKIMCFVFYSILSSNSLQWIEIHRAVRFDAIPLLSEKISPTKCNMSFMNYYYYFFYRNKDKSCQSVTQSCLSKFFSNVTYNMHVIAQVRLPSLIIVG